MKYYRNLNNITYASRNLLTVRVIQRRTVTWRIPPPNSSSSFEVSAMFWDGNFDDIRVNTKMVILLSGNFISTSVFGMALTRPSLTMHLTSGVGIFMHAWVNGRLIYLLLTNIVTIFSHLTRNVSVFVKCDTAFRFFFL